MPRYLFPSLILALMATVAVVSQDRVKSGLFSSTALSGKQPDGSYLIATNQFLQPWKLQTSLRGRPVDAALDPAGRFLAVLNTRTVHVLDTATGAEISQATTRPTSFGGIAFRPGERREIWATETSRSGPDSLSVTPVDQGGRLGKPERVALPGHAVPTGIAFSPDGATAWVALSDRNAVAVIDAAKRTLVREVKTGIAPWSIVFSPKRNRVYVSCRGGRTPSSRDETAYSSSSPVVTDPVTGATVTGVLSIIDAKTFEEAEISVGLAPAGLALSKDESMLAVANAHSDSVTIIDTDSLRSRETLLPAWPEGAFGATPTSLAFSPDGKTLWVACGGSNAIIALTRATQDTWQVSGAVPTAWFPTAVLTAPDGALHVVNVKGMGSTLNSRGTHNSREFEGSVWRIPAPEPARLQAGLREVKAANTPRFAPNGGVQDLAALGIKHVFLIIKENRTYDQVFGDMPKGNGDPSLVMYGRDVTPNHHALAEQFVLLDNFYTGGAISFDGHQWLMQGFVSDYVERAFAASPRGYSWNLADALTVSPKGFFWQDPARTLSVRLFGPFSQPVTWDPATQRPVDINESDLLAWGDYWKAYKEGKWRDLVGHRSGVPALSAFINPRHPASTMNIPDQIRAESWLQELAEREKSGQMPNLSIFTLTSDHTMGTRPGFPTPRAMVADNDLALGRMVEGISKSRFWPNSLILVTEDDAQDGVDHVDGRRTIGLVIGPHVRRGALDSNYYNHSSMIRTIQDVYRIHPRVRYTASARAMNSVFTARADNKPFTAIQPSVSLTEMNPPAKALSGRQLWAARQSMRLNGADIDDFPAGVMNRILWGDAKGWSTPYPGERQLTSRKP